MLLFVVMSQYEATGFLIAAKSILRFNEVASGLLYGRVPQPCQRQMLQLLHRAGLHS